MQDDRSAPLRHTAQPTTIAKGNKVFLLVGGNHLQSASIKEQIPQYFQYLDLLVGEATENKAIRWGEPTSLLSQIEPSAKEKGIERFQTCGGSGALMEDGTLVFPVMAMKGENSVASMIIYSKDGKTWGLPMNIGFAECTDPFIVEWERGQIVMITRCKNDVKAMESRDMGKTWKRAVGAISRVEENILPNSIYRRWLVTSFTTATIAGKKVMLYTQPKVHFCGCGANSALHLGHQQYSHV
ncbi:putative group II trans-sialidase [Trypanosoma rangeli]|uniref:Putative group II trans-sialidase n=1 Tax=Trypanosoma rangeli TaxID=5698 RepID=A0A422NAE5_TRYRA|nr:putative group II trans-sialidase [Trypanosoma rangeli]RNF02421.1 putative group II trans-sialidase [Trypanosoma rangeli]|eukprot:RNF02421.1 putative group II trans-sialidase [Trypanosoma rangeli]